MRPGNTVYILQTDTMEEYKQQQRKPSGTLAAGESPEEQAERDERLNAMQWVHMGSQNGNYLIIH